MNAFLLCREFFAGKSHGFLFGPSNTRDMGLAHMVQYPRSVDIEQESRKDKIAQRQKQTNFERNTCQSI
jgi:hypothetical protein